MSEQIIERTNLLVFFDPEDIEYLRQRQAKHWNEEMKSIGLPALVQTCVKEARLADVMGEKAEAQSHAK